MVRLLVCVFPLLKKRRARKEIQVQRMNTYTEIPAGEIGDGKIITNERHDSEEDYEDLNTNPGIAVTAYRNSDKTHDTNNTHQSSQDKGGAIATVGGTHGQKYYSQLSDDVDSDTEYEDMMNHEYIDLGEQFQPPLESALQNGGYRTPNNPKRNETNGYGTSGKGRKTLEIDEEEDETGYVMPSPTRRLTIRKRFLSIFNKNNSQRMRRKSNFKVDGSTKTDRSVGDQNSFPRKRSKAVKDVNVKKLTELYEKNK
uniref:Uncharacterized protein n=1 Tax=Clytia hemisphaerica TaxID=252671 RepID=A0A7M5XHS7_9CNID